MRLRRRPCGRRNSPSRTLLRTIGEAPEQLAAIRFVVKLP